MSSTDMEVGPPGLDGVLAHIDLHGLLLQRSVEAFLFHEAELLDSHRYRDWLGLLADDITYTAPVRGNRRSDGRVDPETMRWFDENRNTLELRVRRFETDVNWAEEPRSRTRRLVGNVRVATDGDDVSVRSNLLCHRNRGESERGDLIAAERHDVLRAVDGRWQLATRRIMLDHGTLGTKNLAIFL